MAQVKAVPEGMHTITPQLSLDDAAAAIDWYKRAFGAEEINRAIDPSGKKIWHAMVRIGNSMIFVNDIFPNMGDTKAQTARLWLYTPEVDALFKRATDAGAKVTMPLMDMFWGDRMGVLVDPWGVDWCLAEHKKDLTPEQMKQAEQAFIASMKK